MNMDFGNAPVNPFRMYGGKNGNKIGIKFQDKPERNGGTYLYLSKFCFKRKRKEKIIDRAMERILVQEEAARTV